MTDPTQPVASAADAASPTPPEAASAQSAPSLDDIINGYEAETRAQPQPTPPQQPVQTAQPNPLELQMRLDAMERREFSQRETAARNEFFKKIRDDAKVPDYVARGIVADLVENDPKFRKVSDKWAKGGFDDPLTVEAAAKYASDKIKAKLAEERGRTPDPTATADREAVTAAMRGASNQAPPEKPVKYGELSDADFQKERSKYS